MATALQATEESVRLANTTFFELVKGMPELKKVQNLTLALSPQPISKSFLEAARASGGDPMDAEMYSFAPLIIFALGSTPITRLKALSSRVAWPEHV